MSSKKKRKRKSILPNPMRSRNKWAVRGRGLGWFMGSFLYTIANFIVELLILLTHAIGHGIKAWQNRQKPKAKTKATTRTSAPNGFCFKPLSKMTKVMFSDVIGLEVAKQQIRQRMIMPFLQPKKAEALGIPKGGGVLLIGPPGNGKTLLAKAIACELDAPFYHIKRSDLILGGVGASVKRVIELFETLRRHKTVVLFIDEADGILPTSVGSTIIANVRDQLQIELDGMESGTTDTTILLMAATNKPWLISPALRRPGRCDVITYVGLPDIQSRVRQLKLAFTKRQTEDNIDFEILASEMKGYSGADIQKLVGATAQKAFSRTHNEEVSPISMDDCRKALTEVHPSTTAKDLKQFKDFCEQYQIPTEESTVKQEV